MRRVIAFIKDVFGGHCTLFPDGNWGECCRVHDYHYSHILQLSKWQADEYLWYCVLETTGKRWLAYLMFWGLFIFGWPAWWSHRLKYNFMFGR